MLAYLNDVNKETPRRTLANYNEMQESVRHNNRLIMNPFNSLNQMEKPLQ